MLDLSCAFDTVEHQLLMTRLEQSLGITDKALAWLQSYISERYQKVAVGNAESVDSILTCGVPNGSVLGPTLYCMYTNLSEILSLDMVCSIIAMLTTLKSTTQLNEMNPRGGTEEGGIVYSGSGCLVDQKPVKT